tara:strand:+ start:112 stop:1875 length:1764 start_codon:yes stop_codon:yes gene_type:complete
MSTNESKHLIDYISGEKVKATPEEIDSVQPFSQKLVEEYGYPSELIQTRPQYRVKNAPSDEVKKYPVDIAVFQDEKHSDENIKIIVECKQKNRKEGVTQLKNYLSFSRATLGVWFNGEDISFWHKVEKEGKLIFNEIPNIPNYGQRLEDLDKFKRKDLKGSENLKSNFQLIRNYLAANNIGTTRDEQLARQIINLLFCKIYDERFTKPDDFLTFRAGINEEASLVKERIENLFETVKRKYRDVLDKEEKINLDPKSLVFTIGILQDYCLMDSARDAVADAFETFIGPSLKGDKGQFFTPRNVVQMMVEILNPNEEEIVIDPACGSGGFLVESMRYVWKKLEEDAKKYSWTEENLKEEQLKYAISKIRGIEKDDFLAKLSKAYMAILGDGSSKIFVEDTLEKPENWEKETQQEVSLGKYEVLLANPPFGKNLKVTGSEKLGQYDLAFSWKIKDKKFVKNKLKKNVPPQFLFIERCLDLVQDEGRLAIVLPDGIFGNEQTSYIRNWLLEKAQIIAIIDIPLETFLPNTGTKTSVLVLKKTSKAKDNYPIFMTVAEHCGHDRRGKKIDKDDIVDVSRLFHQWKKENKVSF